MKKNKDNIIREQINRLGRPTEEMLDREIIRLDRHEQYGRLIRGILAGLAAAAAAVIIINNLWASLMQIEGSSMNPHLQMADIVLIARGGNPQKSDVIAFYQSNKLHIKRVIAQGGDMVDIDQNGTVSVNGTPLDEPYVDELCFGGSDVTFPFQVPSGTFFVMGDNRPSSIDSRHNDFGMVNREQLVGKVILKIWPIL